LIERVLKVNLDDFHIWQATSIFGKKVTAKSDKNTDDNASFYHDKLIWTDAIWPSELLICER